MKHLKSIWLIAILVLISLTANAQFRPNTLTTNAIVGTPSEGTYLYFSGGHWGFTGSFNTLSTNAVYSLYAGSTYNFLDDMFTVTNASWNVVSLANYSQSLITLNAATRAASCPTPPMYFQMFDAYGENYTPYDFSNDVEALINNGWVAAGYNTILYDNGIATNRDANGHWIPAVQGLDGGTIGGGELNGSGPQTGITKMSIPFWVPWAAKQGVKTWVYTEPNIEELSAPYLGSGGYLESDIAWFITNGVAGLKFDVNTGNIIPDHIYWPYRVAAAIDASGKPFILDLSSSPGANYTALSTYQMAAANTLRIAAAGQGRSGAYGMDAWGLYGTGTQDFWNNSGQFYTNNNSYGDGIKSDVFMINKFAREVYLMDSDLMTYWMMSPGHYIDHESFMVDTTNTVQWAFSWNALMGHPLTPLILPDSVFNIGTDFNELRYALKEPNIIAIDQNSAQAVPVILVTNNIAPYSWYRDFNGNFMTNYGGGLSGYVIAARPLDQAGLVGDSKFALGFFNRSISNTVTVTFGLTNASIPLNTPVYTYNIWNKNYAWVTNTISVTMGYDQCQMFIMWPQLGRAAAPTTSATNLPLLSVTGVVQTELGANPLNQNILLDAIADATNGPTLPLSSRTPNALAGIMPNTIIWTNAGFGPGIYDAYNAPGNAIDFGPANGGILNSNAYTIVLDCQCSSGGVAYFGALTNGGNLATGVEIYGGGTTVYGSFNGSAAVYATANVVDYAPHEVVLAYNGTTAFLYADGILLSSASASPPILDSVAHLQYQGSGPTVFLHGRIWNRYLNPSEVNAIYNSKSLGGNVLARSVYGETDAKNSFAGYIGEYTNDLIPLSAPQAMTTTITTNLFAVTLQPGDWNVGGHVTLSATSATITGMAAGITTTSVTIPSDGSEINSGYQTTTLTEKTTLTCDNLRVNVASPTIVYLATKVTFSAGSVNAYGQLWARRAR